MSWIEGALEKVMVPRQYLTRPPFRTKLLKLLVAEERYRFSPHASDLRYRLQSYA